MIDDKQVILQIFGNLIKNPLILGQVDKYSLTPEDFTRAFDKNLFAVIYSMWENGARALTPFDIENKIKETPSAYEIWEKTNGSDYLTDCMDLAETGNFEYYYTKLKKLNLLRGLKKMGYNTSQFYCEDSLNPDAEDINRKFDDLKPKDIVNILRKKLNKVEADAGISRENQVEQANTRITELFKSLKEKPDTGPRLQGKYFNTIVRGARKGKFFLRSAPSGVGKSRLMIGDACFLSYPIRYSNELQKWEWAGGCARSLYIATEQEIDEIQTMVLAYLSGVNEDKILFGTCNEDEEKRVFQAISIMEIYKDNLHIARMASPNVEQIQLMVRQEVLEHNIDNVFYDYIFSNPALLNEFRDLKIREDVALNLMSSALKDLAVEQDIFIMSATQTNAQVEDTNRFLKNESVIRGSRSIVDKVDMGCVIARITPDEEERIQRATALVVLPNMVTDIYKMRRGRYTQVRIWSTVDLGICRREDILVTRPDFQPVQINNLKQEYEDDTWGIQDNITRLNNGENLTDELSPRAQQITTQYEERKDDIFGGLL